MPDEFDHVPRECTIILLGTRDWDSLQIDLKFKDQIDLIY